MGLELAEEPYDSPDGRSLVAALHADIDERYAHEMVEWSEEERAADADSYLSEVTPDLVRAPDGAFVVARLDGEPVACGAVKALDAGSHDLLDAELRGVRIGEIKRMYTAPAARRRGVSRAVLEALEARAAELGYERLVLETGTAQPEALALYDTAGWTRITAYGHYRDSPESVCYAKDLAPPDGDIRDLALSKPTESASAAPDSGLATAVTRSR